MMPKQSAQGFVLPAAIFLLVVLGGLAAWMMQLTQATQAQDGLAIEGERAYQAAHSGLEAGLYAATQPGVTDCTSITQTVTFTGQLGRFTATVGCTASSADESGVTRRFFQITSVACNQPSSSVCPNAAPTLAEYAERQVRATVEQ